MVAYAKLDRALKQLSLSPTDFNFLFRVYPTLSGFGGTCPKCNMDTIFGTDHRSALEVLCLNCGDLTMDHKRDIIDKIGKISRYNYGVRKITECLKELFLEQRTITKSPPLKKK
jgi:hypothetical protein